MERKVILYLAMSLDGFIADKNGGVGWMDLANNCLLYTSRCV